MSVDARFWFADGVEVFPNLRLPSPPPLAYHFLICEPSRVTRAEDATPSMYEVAQKATFCRREWSESGDVAHYNLCSSPPSGWRWLAVNGSIHAERIPEDSLLASGRDDGRGSGG